MNKTYTLLILFLFPFLSTLAANNNQQLKTISVKFYTEKASIQFDPGLISHTDVNIRRERKIMEFYEGMEKENYQDLLKQFEDFKEKHELCDWLYYKFIRKTIEKMYEPVDHKRKDRLHTMAAWFYLSKLGYATKVGNAAMTYVFLYVKSDEELQKIPKYKDNDGHYYSITNFYRQLGTKRTVVRMFHYQSKEIPTRTFRFQPKQMPNLAPKLAKRTIKFKHLDQVHEWDLMLDTLPLEIMSHYPRMAQMDYLDIRFSKTNYDAIIPKFKELTKGMSKQEAIELIISFTRRGFQYKWDWNIYDDDMSMTAEELLFSEYSDHEDRTAMFYTLVKELVDVPMIVISHYNWDLTVGILLDKPIGRPFEYNGKGYTICDPTMPSNSEELGIYPNGLRKGAEYEILGEYNPNVQSIGVTDE